MEFKVGQIWKNRRGNKVMIVKTNHMAGDEKYVLYSEDFTSRRFAGGLYQDTGKLYIDGDSTLDLIELVKDVDTPNKGHPYAKEMAEYAKDAETNEEPWKLWEVSTEDLKHWHPLLDNPVWYPCCKYRRKPTTFKIGDIDVPVPMTMADFENVGSGFLVVVDSTPCEINKKYYDDSYYGTAISRNLMYFTKEDAQKATDAILALLTTKQND